MAVAVALPLYHNEKHKQNLLQDLNRERFETDSFCDAKLQVDDKMFNIHKCIVGKTSSFFRNLFQVEMKEKYDSFANMKGFTSDVMESVLNFIYTGSVGINDENVFGLLAAANFLMLDGLKLCCRDFLTSNITVDNCVKYHSIGKTYKWSLLERKAAKIMNDNYKEVMGQVDFMSVEKDVAINFFSGLNQDNSGFLAKDIYEGIVAWVKHDVDERRSLLLEFLRLVNFKCLPDRYLDSIKKEHLIKENNEILDFLNEEFEWKHFSLQCQDDNNDCKNIFVIFDKTEVWLFDLFTATWKKLPALPVDASGACFAAYLGHFYVIGGEENPTGIRRIRLDDEETNWETAGRTLQNRMFSKAIVTDDMIVISGGGNAQWNSTNSVETYSNVGSKVQQFQMQPMTHQRYKHSIVKCSGSLYCFGVFVVVKEKNENYNPAHDSKGFNIHPARSSKPALFTNSSFSLLTSQEYIEVRRAAPTEMHDNRVWKVLKSRSFSSCVAVAAKSNIFVIDSEKHMRLYSPKFQAWKSCTACPFAYVDHESFAVSYMEGKVFTFGRVSRKIGEEVEMEYVLGEYDTTMDAWKMNCSFPCNLENAFVSAV